MSKKPDHTEPVPVIGEGATLGVIGAGVMGQTLLRGLLSGKLISQDRVWAGDKNQATCDTASEALGIAVESDFRARVPSADLILLCVKPNDAPVVLATLRNAGLRRATGGRARARTRGGGGASACLFPPSPVSPPPACSRCSQPRIRWSAPCRT